MEELFSINKAAHILERERATLVRALRYMQPDGFQGGQPRWTMALITAALALTPQARRNTGKCRDRDGIRHAKVLDELRFKFEKQVAFIFVEPSLDKRREMAVALAPLLHEYQRNWPFAPHRGR
jgi:hypothetical protein